MNKSGADEDAPKEHEGGCPRKQFWDAGEFEAPCLCKHRASDQVDMYCIHDIPLGEVCNACRSHDLAPLYRESLSDVAMAGYTRPGCATGAGCGYLADCPECLCCRDCCDCHGPECDCDECAPQCGDDFDE